MNYADRQNTAIDRLRGLQIDNILTGAQLDAMRPRFNTLRNRHENGTAPVAVSAFQLFQTPAAIAAQLVALLDLAPGSRVLEPSAGLGRILDALQPCQPAEVVAVETSPDLCAQLYKQNRAGVRLMQRDFLTVTAAEVGQFDAVAMNPPFQNGLDCRHTIHACAFLRAGGILAGICMDGPRQNKIIKPLAETWEPLPARTFSSEGTSVNAVMFTILKCKK